MAEFPIAPEGPYDPRPILQKFLRAFEALLEEAVNSEPGYLIEEEFHFLVQQAFPAIPVHLRQMSVVLDAWWVPPRLTQFGLDGPQLALKLALVSARNREFNAARPQRNGGRGIFKRLLEAIDIPFESLAAALGVGEAVAEFKKVLEKIIPADFSEIS